MGFLLRITDGKGAGREFYFKRPQVTIGRQPDNDLVLHDAAVSRLHCRISAETDGFTLQDNESANGTLINDVLTKQSRIGEGDRIQIGSTIFEFSARAPDGREQTGGHYELRAPMGDKRRRAARAGGAAELDEDTEMLVPQKGRTFTGSFVSARGNVRGLWQHLPRRNKIMLGVALGVVLLGCGGALYRVRMRPIPDNSTTIFPIDKMTASRSFGCGKVDIQTRERANFSFQQHGGRVTIYYAAGGIEAPDEVRITVNNQEVGYVMVSNGKWTRGLNLILPRKLLHNGSNLLTFDNRLNPPGHARWGVAEITMVEEPLPPLDVTHAQQLYDLGRAAFDSRSVTPANLSHAITYFEQARRFVDAALSPPPLAEQIDAGLARAQDELQTIFDAHIFAAEKAVHFNDTEGAVEALNELLAYFPNANDPRSRQVRDRLATLTGQNVP